MEKFRCTKASIIAVLVAIFLLLNIPSVLGAFELVIYPDDKGPIQPGVERRKLDGFAEYIQPSRIISNLPFAWFWQQYSIKVESKPEWASVTVTPPESLVAPNKKENIMVHISVTENAPAYQDGVIRFDIESGFFIRNTGIGRLIFPSYALDTEIPIKSGYLPLLTTTNPPPEEGRPNSEVHHTIPLKNTGNARSLIKFSVDSKEVKSGWNVQVPPPVFIDPDDEVEVFLTVLTPRDFGYIDEWEAIPVNIEVMSALEGEVGPRNNFTVSTISHCVGYYVPNVPGGNDPGVVFGTLVAIVIVIIVIIIVIVRMVKKTSLTKKLKLKKRGKED
jgi:hypothetical protein